MPERKEVRILGLDFGSHRIGVAVSDPLGITAQPLAAIRRQGDIRDIGAIGALVRKYSVGTVLIGLPLTLRGEEGVPGETGEDVRGKNRGTPGDTGRNLGRADDDRTGGAPPDRIRSPPRKAKRDP